MRPALLRRFPALRFQPTSEPVISASAMAAYPALEKDLAVVGEVAGPAFQEQDLLALREQNRYRLRTVQILVGSSLLTGLGGLEMALPDQSWPGALLGILGATVAWLTRSGGDRRTQQRYLSARLRAERLRGLHFRYLARTPPFDSPDDDERRKALRHAVAAVRSGKEPE